MKLDTDLCSGRCALHVRIGQSKARAILLRLLIYGRLFRARFVAPVKIAVDELRSMTARNSKAMAKMVSIQCAQSNAEFSPHSVCNRMSMRSTPILNFSLEWVRAIHPRLRRGIANRLRCRGRAMRRRFRLRVQCFVEQRSTLPSLVTE